MTPELPTPAGTIVRAVAARYFVTPLDIRSRRRDRHTAYARHIAMYLCRHLTVMSLTEIGRQFDRDHTTVLKALRRIEKMSLRDDGVTREIGELWRGLERRPGEQ